MSDSIPFPKERQAENQIHTLVVELRESFTALGIGHEHLSDAQFSEVLATAVYLVQRQGRELTWDRLMWALQVMQEQAAVAALESVA